MKKVIIAVLLVAVVCSAAFAFTGCEESKIIRVCASDVPHAEILNDVVSAELEKKGYHLNVKVMSWTVQNASVAGRDYDANYFQHLPYLEEAMDNLSRELFATCKVHYEPLGIYYGKSQDVSLNNGKTFAICNDPSNAARAFQLLEANGIISKTAEGANYPVNEKGDGLNLGAVASDWTSADGNISVKLIAENLLVSSRKDYDFVLLPCNTALTGNVTVAERVAVESDPAQVVGKANVIAARLDDYKNNKTYKAKIDALTEVMLSEAVSEYIATKYNGVIICDSSTQIDLRGEIA